MQQLYTCEGIKRSKAKGEVPFDNEANQEAWLVCETLADFGNATADWLEGKIGFSPTTTRYTSPNDETLALLPYINPLNRTGRFVSTFSQPASSPGNNPLNAMMENQRAVLSGFATYEMMQELASRAGKIGLKTLVSRPGASRKISSVPVTRKDGKDYTWTGHVKSSSDITRGYGGHGSLPGLKKELINILLSCYQVYLIDEEYGNNDRLWPMTLDVAQSSFD